MRSPPPLEHLSWFGSPATSAEWGGSPSAVAALDDSGETGFARLWAAFMTARVMVALVVLVLHATIYMLAFAAPPWLVTLCAVYLVQTLGVRLLARPRGQGRRFDAQWLYTVGADLAFYGLLHLQQKGSINYSPLLALPVLMAAVLGSPALALGTAALATLLMLGSAAWSAAPLAWTNTSDLAQAGLTGAGLLVLAWLTSHLSGRLAREERIARRSRAEAKRQALVNNLVIETLSDGVLVVDTERVVHAANPAARLMLGSDHEVTPPVFSLDDSPAWVQLADIAQITFMDTAVDAAEVTLRHDDRQSSLLQVRTQRTPSVGEGGKSLCVMFLQDLRELEARMRTEKLAAMGRMSAAVAHEIRNPLAAIVQANALLEEDLEQPAQRRLTTMVRQNAERLRHIVDDVLDIARVQHRAEGTAQTLLLDADTTAICLDWAQQNRAGVRLAVSPRAPEVRVRFAHEHLRRVLVNLLDNALRYASSAEGAIEVATQVSADGAVMLRVWSDGPPMEPTVRRHLFEPFFSSESRSSGLGLFICRELCERHGAAIAYDRSARARGEQPVEGNEFFVSFKRAHSGHSLLPGQELD